MTFTRYDGISPKAIKHTTTTESNWLSPLGQPAPNISKSITIGNLASLTRIVVFFFQPQTIHTGFVTVWRLSLQWHGCVADLNKGVYIPDEAHLVLLQEDNARQRSRLEPLPGGRKFRAAVLSMDGTLITTQAATNTRKSGKQAKTR